jgi:hypothetical protein
MRNRLALIPTTVTIALCVLVLTNTSAGVTTKEASWKSSRISATTPSERTDLLSNEALMPLAVFATAVMAYEDNTAAAAYAQAEASVLASKEAALSRTPPASGPSSPTTTTTGATGACGAEDQISPGPAALAESQGVPCAWVPTAVCEESGRDDPYAGFFGILEWQGYGGYSAAGAAPLSVQLGWEAAHGQGPPDAPGQCAGY